MKNLNSWLIVTVLLALLSACSPGATPEARQETEAVPTSMPGVATGFYHEAPQLAELVAAGALPPVEERLPQNPLVVQPVERVGVYGGAWQTGLRGDRDHALLIRTAGYENLVRWDPQWIRVVPNIAQFVEVNEAATAYTFHLREGMRWSDGAPFTADDIMFWYNDVFSNPSLTASPPVWLTAGDEPVVVEKVDDSTVVFRFAVPYGLFLQKLAEPYGSEPTLYPRHYLEQFHADHNPQIERLVQEAGVADWVELFQLKHGLVGNSDNPENWQNPDQPTLHAWLLTEGYSGQAEQVVAERNPYYWKVDTAFNQLPYIDRLVYTRSENEEELLSMVLNGEIDMQSRHLSPQHRAMLEANMEAGGYHFFTGLRGLSNQLPINLNLTHPDPVLRQIFQNRDFRIGLSYAIDRQAIIDEVHNGQGVPYQTAPLPNSPFYHEQLATQYTAYDVALANEYLDRAGYTERDGEGFRLGPDGQRIVFSLEFLDTSSEQAAALERVQTDWRAVGIDMRLQPEGRELFTQRRNANQHDALTFKAEGGLEVILAPAPFLPYNEGSAFAIAWVRWYQDPNDPRAEEPPQIVQQQIAWYDQLLATGDPNKQDELMKRILEVTADQFYTIGLFRIKGTFGIVKNNFHNVPEVLPLSWSYPNPGPANPCQFFIDPQE